MQIELPREEIISIINLIANSQIRGADAIVVAALIQKLQGFVRNVEVDSEIKKG